MKPVCFNALIYLESPNFEASQGNLRKLEPKLLMQKENANKHNSDLR